jgi:dihydrodipicolinate synthase/N-acetylneuraminate lyase
VRRVTAVSERLGDRLAIFAGMDDMILESIPMGAVGWIAGLVNAFPEESVQLFELGVAGRMREARELYEWFLPLLRLDTVPKFVQLIKLAQAEVGRGTAIVRPPRLELEGDELAEVRTLLRSRIASRVALDSTSSRSVTATV